MDIEIDSQIVARQVKKNALTQGSMIALIIGDCLESMSLFSDVNINFIRRSANLAAHTLARKADVANRVEWISTPPDFLFHALHIDLN